MTFSTANELREIADLIEHLNEHLQAIYLNDITVTDASDDSLGQIAFNGDVYGFEAAK